MPKAPGKLIGITAVYFVDVANTILLMLLLT